MRRSNLILGRSRITSVQRRLSSARFLKSRSAAWADWLALWPLLLPLLLLVPGIAGFPYPSPQAQYSDLAISHYPNALFLRQALLKWHSLPLWSPTILSGYPFAANPLSGLWYPPGWLALALPLPLGFNLLAALHLLWGGAGLFALLRAEGLPRSPAVLGALAFASMPKLFAHYGAGHLTLLYAVPWTPWLLLAGRRAMDRLAAARESISPHGRLATLFQPGLVLALIFLADPRWAAYAGLLWLAYALAFRPPGVSVRRLVPHLALQGLLAGLLAAPLALPLLEYTRLTTRSHLAVKDVFAYALPPINLIGLLFPALNDGFHEWVLYPGAALLALALLVLVWRSTRRRAAFWLSVAGVALLVSLGPLVPGLSLLGRLPGFDLLRVPSRALFLSGLAFAALGAQSVSHLLEDPSPQERRAGNLALLLLFALAAGLAGGVFLLAGSLAPSFAWGAGATALAALWIGLRLNRRLPTSWWIAGLVCLCLLDWLGVDHSLFVYRPAQDVLMEGQAAAGFLAGQPGLFRVYSPSYSLPQQTAAFYGLQLADGVDPLQLQAYADFMVKATGVPDSGYSVTLPPYAGGPKEANAAYLPDPGLLGLLNVRYVAAEYDLPVSGLKLVSRFGSTRLYENTQALPRLWLQPVSAKPGQEALPIAGLDWSPDRIGAQVDVPENGASYRLVLSEINAPGWWVSVDGRPAKLQTYAGLLRSVDLGPGRHQVVFTDRPLSVYAGLALGLLGLVLLFWRAWR